MTKSNSTFSGGTPTWANACVGNNGSIGYWEYANGFSNAAKILIEAVLKDEKMYFYVDQLIYPACFNMRHSVELRLKGAIDEMRTIAQTRDIPFDYNPIGSHDINAIWELIVSQSSRIDERYAPLLKKVEGIINDIGQVDPTGQTFRYPINTDSQKHLVNVSVINFKKLQLAFETLEKELNNLHALGTELVREYKLGTFTKNLSRLQLWNLAIDLPVKNEWCKASFPQLRDELKEKYGLSGREFSKAVDIIIKHYELAPLIGEHPPLLGVELKHLISFIDYNRLIYNWGADNENDSAECSAEDDASSLESVLGDIREDAEKSQKAWDEFGSSLRPENLAGLESIICFGRQGRFSEEYVSNYKFSEEGAQILFGSSHQEIRERFNHILQNPIATTLILKALFKLKKSDMAEVIIKQYSLNAVFDWLDEARNSSLSEDHCMHRKNA